MTGVTAKCIRMLTQAKAFYGHRKTFKIQALMTDSGHFEIPMLRRHGQEGRWLSL